MYDSVESIAQALSAGSDRAEQHGTTQQREPASRGESLADRSADRHTARDLRCPMLTTITVVPTPIAAERHVAELAREFDASAYWG